MEIKRTSTIQYPIAKDKHGDWVHISEAEREKRYYCPECEGRLTPRLGQIKAHHFAHYPGYKAKCTGETTYHSRGKHILKYHFDTKEWKAKYRIENRWNPPLCRLACTSLNSTSTSEGRYRLQDDIPVKRLLDPFLQMWV